MITKPDQIWSLVLQLCPLIAEKVPFDFVISNTPLVLNGSSWSLQIRWTCFDGIILKLADKVDMDEVLD